jgi:hypothetical protein
MSEQLVGVIDHVGGDHAPGSDVHRTGVEVFPRGLARGGVGVKNAVEDANCSRVSSRGELNDEAVKNGDKVTLDK